MIVLGWILAIGGFYACYYHTNETWWYLRFVLPAFPPLLIAAAMTVQTGVHRFTGRLTERISPVVTTMVAVPLVALSVLAMQQRPEYAAFRQARADDRVYRDTIAWIRLNNVADRPLLLGQLSGAAHYYAPDLLLIRFDRFSPEGWTSLRDWQARTGTTVDAALASFESQQFFAGERARLPCQWRPRGSFRWVVFWECPPPTTR
jgi:hypothetical protein